MGVRDVTQAKPLVFTRIKSSEELPSSSRSQEKALIFGRLGKINEVQSIIPSRMKRLSIINVSTDCSESKEAHNCFHRP